MNKHRTKMINRKARAGRGPLFPQQRYAKPEIGYDLSNTKRKEMK